MTISPLAGVFAWMRHKTVMRQLLRCRRLETGDFDTLRIDTIEHHTDGGVLVGGVHRLQYDQQLVLAFGVKQLLQGFEFEPQYPQFCPGILLVAVDEWLPGLILYGLVFIDERL